MFPKFGVSKICFEESFDWALNSTLTMRVSPFVSRAACRGMRSGEKG
jgi:hypothetical protein